MNRIIILICIVFTILSCGRSDNKMKYSDIGRKTGITGSLGKPLGTIIRIQGQLKKGEKSKADMDNIIIEVIKVDDKILETPVVIPMRMFSWSPVPEPGEDQVLQYLGYETGGMTGIPEEAFSHMPYVATTEYAFTVYFQVIKSIE
jgi:hypothetical protein